MGKCLSLANGRRQLPLVTGGRGLGTGPQLPSPGPPHLWTCQGRPCQGRGERRLQIRNSASPGRDPNPRPLAQALAQQPPSEEGRGRYSLRGGGPEGAGGPNPPARRFELEPAQARRCPPRPGGSGPASPPAARQPPRWPLVPARPPRAPRRSRSRTRPRGAARPRPFSPCGPRRAEPRTPPVPPGPYWLPRPPLPSPPPAPARELPRAAFALAPPPARAVSLQPP